MNSVKNLVFDLGGVLYAIDPGRTTEALVALLPEGLAPGEDAWTSDAQPIFDALEEGKLDPVSFRGRLRETYGLLGQDAEIDAAWNKLLLGVMPGRVEALQYLARHYRLILLSNTNLIHQIAIAEECAPLFAAFERVFFSYEMDLRKPNPAIYTQALEVAGMEAHESLFIDDNFENVVGAKAAGLQGRHIRAHSEEDWRELMAKLGYFSRS